MRKIAVTLNKKIFIGITNNKKLIEGNSLVFDFYGDKNEYEIVKQTIVVFLFLNGVQFVYFPDLDDIKDIKQLSCYSLEHHDKDIERMEITKKKQTI